MARPNPLAEPGFAKSVAAAFVAGLSRQEMADQFGVKDLDTITRWRRDPRVQAPARKLIEDRILQITRKVDSQIEARLQEADKLPVKDLLDIRKEFLGGALRAQTEKADDETITQAIEAMEENPELLEQIQELLGQQPVPSVPED